VTDLAALRYWATPGADVHLVTHAESIDEVRGIAGVSAAAQCVQGFTDPAFLESRRKDEARAELALPADAKIVLVSGGGWGVGRIETAVEVALALPQVGLIVCLCGRNDELRTRVERRFATQERVRVEGFTQAMPDWLAAADVLVHSTAGLTILEALIRGCPAISFGWGRGHIRLNNAAFRRFGLAEVAGTQAELRSALVSALESERRPDLGYARLPSAASIVLAQADDGPRPRENPAGDSDDRKRGDQYASAEGRIAPMLTADKRRQQDGDRDLHGEHGRPDP
jgi:UDP-N-acetylglucosamine:LPS N-acetylglucosamine transferase